MTKKRSRNLFIVFAIVLLVCLIFCFVNFTYPFAIGGNYYSYSSFVSNLRFGEDTSSSLRIVYRGETPDNVSDANYDELCNATMDRLQEIVQGEGYKDVTVAKRGEDEIVVTIGNLLTKDDQTSIENLIGSPVSISFSNEEDGSEPFAGGNAIKGLSTGSITYEGELYFYTQIDIKEESKALFAEKGEDTIYIYLGDNEFTEWTEGVDDGYIRLYSDTFESIQDAERCANQIKTGMLNLTLTQLESTIITPSYGVASNVWVAVVLTTFVVAMLAYLIVKYKQLGLVGCFAMLFYIVISLFLLQSIPAVHLNFGGIIALGLGMMFAVYSLINLFENAKNNYRAGTKFYISIKTAFKDNLAKELFMNALLVVAGFICLFMPSMSVQSFGWVLFVLPMVNAFTSLVLMRLFAKMYLAFNPNNGTKCNFNQGGKND